MSHTDRTPVDRLGLEVLSADECWELLASTPIGRVAFVDAGEPVVFPVTHGVHGRSVVFRSGSGTKLEAASMAQPVAFEVDGWDHDRRVGWSVLARGVGETVYDEDEIEAFAASGVEPWIAAAAAGTWIRLRVDEISGRRIRA